MRYLWMPRLVERIQAASAPTTTTTAATATTGNYHLNNMDTGSAGHQVVWPQPNNIGGNNFGGVHLSHVSLTPENSSTAGSSESFGRSQVSPVSELTDCYYPVNHNLNQDYLNPNQIGLSETLTSPTGYFNQGLDMQTVEPNNTWLDGGALSDNLWNIEDYWFMQQQFSNNI